VLVAKMKGSAMSLSYNPTIDDLLADSLIQTVMRADHVEPQALRSLMHGVASQVAESRGLGARQPALLLIGLPNDRRAAPRAGNAPPPRRPARSPNLGSALCC
jgi:hypothetical protein